MARGPIAAIASGGKYRQLTHARMTLFEGLHSSRKGKEEFKNLHHEVREARRGNEGRSEKLEGGSENRDWDFQSAPSADHPFSVDSVISVAQASSSLCALSVLSG